MESELNELPEVDFSYMPTKDRTAELFATADPLDVPTRHRRYMLAQQDYSEAKAEDTRWKAATDVSSPVVNSIKSDMEVRKQRLEELQRKLSETGNIGVPPPQPTGLPQLGMADMVSAAIGALASPQHADAFIRTLYQNAGEEERANWANQMQAWKFNTQTDQANSAELMGERDTIMKSNDDASNQLLDYDQAMKAQEAQKSRATQTQMTAWYKTATTAPDTVQRVQAATLYNAQIDSGAFTGERFDVDALGKPTAKEENLASSTALNREKAASEAYLRDPKAQAILAKVGYDKTRTRMVNEQIYWLPKTTQEKIVLMRAQAGALKNLMSYRDQMNAIGWANAETGRMNAQISDFRSQLTAQGFDVRSDEDALDLAAATYKDISGQLKELEDHRFKVEFEIGTKGATTELTNMLKGLNSSIANIREDMKAAKAALEKASKKRTKKPARSGVRPLRIGESFGGDIASTVIPKDWGK